MRTALLIAALALAVSVAFAQPASLIRNPGLEAGPDKPAEWDLGMEGRGAGSATWVTDNPHTGTHCVRIEMLEPGDYWMARQTYAAGTAKPQHRYCLSGWYHATEGICHPTLYYRNAANEFIGAFETTLPASDEWKPFSFVITTPAGTDRFELQLRAQGGPGTCWYDDIALRDGEEMAQQGAALVQPLLKLAADNPEYLWALASDAGTVSWEFVGRPAVEVAWAVQTAPGAPAEGASSIRATTVATGGQTKRDEVAANPANPALRSKRIVFSAAGVGPARTIIRAENDASGAERVMLVGVRLAPPVTDSLSRFEAQSVSNATDLPWQTRVLPASAVKFALIRDLNRSDLLRDALGAKEGEPDARICSAWLNNTDDQWLDWALSRKSQARRDPDVSGVRNEHVSLQALFLPVSKPSKVTASVSALKGAAGAAIPASASQVRMLEYVPFNGQWLPDPLMDQQPFTPSTHGPVVFWITLHLPENARPGDYTGTLTMQADHGKPLTREFTIRVWDVTLPSETHLQSSFWLFRGQIRNYFNLPGDVPMETYYPYIDLATSHRLSPIDVVEGPCEPLVKVYREADGTLSYDFAEWDKYLDRMKRGGASTIHIAFTHWMAHYFTGKEPKVIDRQTGQTIALGYAFGSKEHLDALGNYLRAAADHLKKRGEFGRCYIQPWDEPNGEGLQSSYTILKGIRDRVPEIPRLMDAINPDALGGKMKDVVNLWCPLSPQVESGASGAMGTFDAMRKRGDTLWWYVCCGPQAPYANLFTNWKVAEVRALFWQTWQYHCTGVLYWGLNYWNAMDRPLTPAERAFPRGPWQSSTTGQNYMGDGYSIYPGFTADHPLSSLRLETMRDGIEDYELLHLLNALVERDTRGAGTPAAGAGTPAAGQATPAGGAGTPAGGAGTPAGGAGTPAGGAGTPAGGAGTPARDPTALARAREVLAVRPSISKNLREFDRTGDAMDRERAEIVKLIGRLQAAH